MNREKYLILLTQLVEIQSIQQREHPFQFYPTHQAL